VEIEAELESLAKRVRHLQSEHHVLGSDFDTMQAEYEAFRRAHQGCGTAIVASLREQVAAAEQAKEAAEAQVSALVRALWAGHGSHPTSPQPYAALTQHVRDGFGFGLGLGLGGGWGLVCAQEDQVRGVAASEGATKDALQTLVKAVVSATGSAAEVSSLDVSALVAALERMTVSQAERTEQVQKVRLWKVAASSPLILQSVVGACYILDMGSLLLVCSWKLRWSSLWKRNKKQSVHATAPLRSTTARAPSWREWKKLPESTI